MTSGLPFICFTDDPTLRSDSWQIRLVEPLFPSDPARSQREIKLRPHAYVGDFASSLYIDNSVVLTTPPDAWLAEQLATHAMAVPTHSNRETVRDEFLVVLSEGLDDPTRFEEQLEHYEATSPECLTERPYWAGMLLRKHNDETVRRAMELWFQHVLRYSRRDQVSLNIALRQAGLSIARIEIDNQAGPYHRWPVRHDRLPTRVHQRTAKLRSRVAELESVIEALGAEAGLARQLLAERDAELDIAKSTAAAIARDLAEVRSSTSWTIGNGLMRLLRKVRPLERPRR